MNGLDYSKLSHSELLTIARDSASEMFKILPKTIYLGSLTLESKLPWKAVVLRESLLHRFSDFLDAAVKLYDADRAIPAFSVTRAVMETTAMMYWLSIKAKEFSETKDVDAFDEFLMKGMFGGRDVGSPLSPYNILTAVDHIDKQINGTRAIYDILCEFTHPNYAGVLGSYTHFDVQQHITYFGKEQSKVQIEFGLIPLVACIEVFEVIYNSLASTLKEINDSYARNSTPKAQ